MSERLSEDELQSLIRKHYTCEDRWYSCPKSEDGCCNDAAGTDCCCGVDEYNADLQKLIDEVREGRQKADKLGLILRDAHRGKDRWTLDDYHATLTEALTLLGGRLNILRLGGN